MNAGNQPSAAAAMPLCFPHPIDGLAGTSFKHEHLPAILAQGPQRGFFEVHAENYMGAGGPPHRALETIRRDHPVSLHGVCMSIGAPQPLDQAHLVRFRNLVDRYQPALVSEHLAWSSGCGAPIDMHTPCRDTGWSRRMVSRARWGGPPAPM